MKTELIKDIINYRWKIIASKAYSIAHIANVMWKTEELNDDALQQISDCKEDMEINLASLEQMLNAIDMAEKIDEMRGITKSEKDEENEN